MSDDYHVQAEKLRDLFWETILTLILLGVVYFKFKGN